jgi:hypothetical protein
MFSEEGIEVIDRVVCGSMRVKNTHVMIVKF